LVDENDLSESPRVLFYLDNEIRDASLTPSGDRRTISKQMLYVELDSQGNARHLHYAPYLDYRPLAADEPNIQTLLDQPQCSWITRDLEQQVQSYAIANVVPKHLQQVRDHHLSLIKKTREAVKERLTMEINYWDHRAETLKMEEQAGKKNARINWHEARRRADDLQARLQKRLEQLDFESQISPLPPVVLGGVVVLPQGLIDKLTNRQRPSISPATDTQAAAAKARAIIMETELSLGFEPVDKEFEKLGYDIESRDPATGKLRFIEVKGRIAGAATVTVTKNEILHSLNKPDDYILAIVEFLPDDSHAVHYIRQPFQREPDFGVTSVNYNFEELLQRAEAPA